MATKRCYYEVLSLTKSADSDSIKVSYRKLAMQYHPDRNVGNAEAEVLFKEAAEAYEILRDPEKDSVMIATAMRAWMVWRCPTLVMQIR